MNKLQLFSTPIIIENHFDLVEELNSLTDHHIVYAKNRDLQKIEKRNADIDCSLGDKNWVYHSEYNLFDNPNFKKYHDLIGKKSREFLDEMGYDLSNYSLVYDQSWVQEFSETGGGDHHFHIHSDTHISGFLFLKCSEKTSFPVFMDPRTTHIMMKLPEKDKNSITNSSEYINIKPKVGDMVMFPSYVSHSFSVDYGLEPFRIMHFTLKAIHNRYL